MPSQSDETHGWPSDSKLARTTHHAIVAEAILTARKHAERRLGVDLALDPNGTMLLDLYV